MFPKKAAILDHAARYEPALAQAFKTEMQILFYTQEIRITTGGFMKNDSIAQAVKILEELLAGLDEAYWEACNIERKDFFYDIISAVHSELSEIGKLSVQDHDLVYEPITVEFKAARAKLSRLRNMLDDFVLRSSTSSRLETLINDAVALPLR